MWRILVSMTSQSICIITSNSLSFITLSVRRNRWLFTIPDVQLSPWSWIVLKASGRINKMFSVWSNRNRQPKELMPPLLSSNETYTTGQYHTAASIAFCLHLILKCILSNRITESQLRHRLSCVSVVSRSGQVLICLHTLSASQSDWKDAEKHSYSLLCSCHFDEKHKDKYLKVWEVEPTLFK